ncbi:MAG: FAD-dependent oxidoreductase, partial [Bacteroidetes bacterium]|nr:FAD-dependent oxidoreductase [Bacteroidota bacterium]
FGIPGFKLEKSVVQKRRKFLEDMGIEFHLNTEIGKAITIEQLQQSHDAVFLGMGTYTPLDGGLPGLDTKGVIKALDYLIGNINHQQSYAMEQFPYFDMKDQHVLVVGGGDTAMDCVRSAVRQQAASVRCVYRRTEKEMPGSKQEVQNAKEEGVEFVFHRQPIAIESSDGTMTAVRFKITGDGEDAGEELLIEGDRLIIAFGFTASPANWFEQAGVEINEKGLIKTLESKDSTL